MAQYWVVLIKVHTDVIQNMIQIFSMSHAMSQPIQVVISSDLLVTNSPKMPTQLFGEDGRSSRPAANRHPPNPTSLENLVLHPSYLLKPNGDQLLLLE